MSRHHELEPLPANIAWGHLDAAVGAALHIASADTVHLKSWCAGDESDLQPTVPSSILAIGEQVGNASAGRRFTC